MKVTSAAFATTGALMAFMACSSGSGSPSSTASSSGTADSTSGGNSSSAGNSSGTNSSSGTGGPMSCPNVTACGGDVVGTWTVASSCLKLSGNVDIALAG